MTPDKKRQAGQITKKDGKDIWLVLSESTGMEKAEHEKEPRT